MYERFILDLGKRENSEPGVGRDGMIVAYHRFGGPIQGLHHMLPSGNLPPSRQVEFSVFNRILQDEENLQIG